MLQQKNKHRLLIAGCITVILALLVLIALSGGNLALLKSLFTQDFSNEELRDQLNDFGWRGYIVITALATLQVVFTFLPAEPIQVLAGITFSVPVALLCCMVGVLLGNSIIFMLQKTFGDRLRSFFYRKMNLDLEKIARSSKAIFIVFILYFLPAIPYGMICFFAAGLGMRYRRYIFVTALGALPSVCIGIGLGYMAITSNWVLTLCVFAVFLLVVTVMLRKKEAMFSWLNNYAEHHKNTPKNRVRAVNPFVMNTVYYAARLYLFLSGIRIQTVNKVDTLQTPSIVLCNHGSFIDFIYAAALLRKHKPHFITARLYFYNKYLGWLLRSVGAFPKSMFAVDLENARNCLTVLKEGSCLAMMPEARLSTVGRFEDIQSNTYAFIKKSGVPVYTVKINGDYLADPKWGTGFRRGALVEAELELLFTTEEVKTLSLKELQQSVEKRISYDEFQWLQQRPKVRYRSRRMAEGLENVLMTCPICKQKHSITTKKNQIFCQNCGYLTSLDERYRFTEGFQFETFAQWYDWQKSLLEKEITENSEYTLTSNVELRLSGTGSGLTRFGGHGVCSLDRTGLTYSGSKDGENVELHFPIQRIYRLLFGAGKNFEIYDGTEILFFVPEDTRSAVDWYMASMILHDSTVEQ